MAILLFKRMALGCIWACYETSRLTITNTLYQFIHKRNLQQPEHSVSTSAPITLMKGGGKLQQFIRILY